MRDRSRPSIGRHPARVRALGILLCAIAAASPTPGSTAVSREAGRPNILIMVADDLGYADLGCQGSPDFRTPNIDSIAARGARFTSGYVSAPVCSPCRAGLLTGRYQTRFGHELNHPLADRAPVGLPVGETLAPEYFRRAGYATGHVGKWHLGNTEIEQFRPTARGFDESLHFAGQRKLPRPDGQLPYRRDNQPAAMAARYVDEAMGAVAADFIGRHQGSPWFLYVAFLTPHQPLDVPPEAEDAFRAIDDPNRRKCASMLALMDGAVGRILEAIRRTGQEEETLVVFLSDNGAPPGNGSRVTPLSGTKGTTWEGGIRIPFVIQWPGRIAPGRVVDVPVIALDLLPTTLAAAGLRPPEGPRFDGVDLLPLLGNEEAPAPHASLCWRYGDQWAIRSGDWKLVHARERGDRLTTRLVNLADDPGETNDLSASQPDRARDLRAAWEAWDAENVPPLWSSTSP